MTNINNIPLSVLDPSPITTGGSAEESLHNTLDLAIKAEQWGYKRFWLAEHHNWIGMASSATPLVMSRVASVTEKMRVGSGAMLLSHYAPLSVAEQFGTLEAFFPERIDLGLGRAPGTDYYTANVLRPRFSGEPEFDERLQELFAYLHGAGTTTQDGSHRFRAIPGENSKVPIWLLGSNTYSAELAGKLGLPFSFAGHFAASNMMNALAIYRENFQPSDMLDKPYVLLSVQVAAADTEKEAKKLATSMYQKFLLLSRNQTATLQPPVDDMDALWSEQERKAVEEQLSTSIIGDRAGVKEQLEALIAQTEANEIMAHTEIFDHQARLRSYEILADAVKS
ncbi:LLM class flavin-dependent oxidoreductase [Halalkalibacter nanhaiisediminis]|uniref:Luciferase family oxidoreductase group 1 n=1 Tax=Halalkalibacter nanhaiisediminis TaxID=688079 RepID=A0A562QD67_9BACI|nr:LLM class flavin-dependent oxidoreductase [Halalkalibacter nanhaiisediminis]TWI54702.1 luciferase family oxidoreductase group 1 [Halalkalibacter nanhaiisediminis]